MPLLNPFIRAAASWTRQGGLALLRQAWLREILSVALCCELSGQLVLAQTGQRAQTGQPAKTGQAVERRQASAAAAPEAQVQGDERVLHALNRFTFGPRSEDLVAAKTMGLDAWFERQLNPSAIDDTAFEQRLWQFPAMQMTQQELIRRYPGPQVIRALSRNQGQYELPSDARERAIYQDQIAFYELQQAKKAAGKNDGAGAAGEAAMAGRADAAASSREAGSPSDIKESSPTAEKALPASAIADTADGSNTVHKETLFPQSETSAILLLPPDQRAARIFGMKPEELIGFRQSLSGREAQQLTAGMSPLDREQVASLQGSLKMVASEAMQTRLLRDIYSERQLEAVMTDFWLNHFNVYVRKNQKEAFLLPAYERDTIRPHALGKFEDLLVATAKSPAMLEYLDNWQSVGPESDAALTPQRRVGLGANGKVRPQRASGLNENYGRELMELHTLGVGGGYTQADVTQVSKVFTGWTIEQPARGAGYIFDPRRHEPGAKTVLGVKIKEGGEEEGLKVLHLLATSPATAHFISQKLAVRFVSDAPPSALVDRMAKSYLGSGGDIKEVLRTMFHSPEFWSSRVYRAKVKTPIEFVASSVRASGARVGSTQGLVQSLDRLGMPLYGMQTPNGYSWTGGEWISSGALVNRLNFALVMSGDRMPGVRTEWASLLGEMAGGRATPVSFDLADGVDPALLRKERRLEEVLLGEPVSERTRLTVLGQSGDTAVADQAALQFKVKGGGGRDGGLQEDLEDGQGGQSRQDRQDSQAAVMAGLLLGSPEFQRR